jgi:extradiol dioxygenase family protein
VIAPADWRSLAGRLQKAGADFIIEPNVRFKGEPGEQGTFFIRDPAGNALEFKCFEDMGQLFAT